MLPRCRITDDDTDASGNAVQPAYYAGRSGSDDGGPKPRSRGSYAGFLPDGVVNDLRASADSGAGLAVMAAPSTHRERDGLLLGIALLSLYLALRQS